MTTEAEHTAAMELQAPLNKEAATPLAATPVPISFESFVEAVGSGKLSAEAVEKLTDVFLKVQATRAEQEYNVAFAAFQRDCPPIPKRHIRKWTAATAKGTGWTTYYANIEDIMPTIGPCLLQHGFSISFEDQDVKAGVLVEHCRCSHTGGHSRTAPCHMPLESSSPAMSAQDRFDAASTRAKRGALCKILGLWSASSKDDDGEVPPYGTPEPEPELLTQQQQEHIAELVRDVNQNWDSLLGWLGVANLAEARQDKYDQVVSHLKRKKQQQTKGQP